MYPTILDDTVDRTTVSSIVGYVKYNIAEFVLEQKEQHRTGVDNSDFAFSILCATKSSIRHELSRVQVQRNGRHSNPNSSAFTVG